MLQFWRLCQLLASQKIFEGSKFVTTLSWNTVEANWKKIRQWLPKSQKTSFTVWLILGTADNASTCYFTQKNTLKSGWEMTCSISIGRHIGDIRFLIWGLGYRNVALMLAILDPNPWWSDGSNFRECRILNLGVLDGLNVGVGGLSGFPGPNMGAGHLPEGALGGCSWGWELELLEDESLHFPHHSPPSCSPCWVSILFPLFVASWVSWAGYPSLPRKWHG